jgi:outer membrane biosynthesis protein TonB
VPSRRINTPRLSFAVVAMLTSAPAAPAIEPLRVQLSVQGKGYEGEGCEGGEWSVSWRGELPAETSDVTDLITSYSSFDSTNERHRVDPPAQVTAKPVVCRDDNGAIVMRSSLSGGTRKIRGVASLNENPSIPSPSFDFAIEDAGTCTVWTPMMTQTLEQTLLHFRAPTMSALTPAFALTREDLERGFTRRYRLGGQALSSAFMCLGATIERGELVVSYKQDAREPRIRLAGCAHLPRGASTSVTASVEPPGGAVRFTSDPSATLALNPSGASVHVTAAEPGRATLTGEYTLNGKTASATLPASSVELISVNAGDPIPKLGLLGFNGRPSSKVYAFPFQSNPADAGDLLIFTVENEALASVVTNRNSIGVQPVREGRTRIQAKTACGAPLGSPIEIEIATCDPQVRTQLEQAQQELIERERQLVKRITQLVAGEEFQRAATEIRESTINLATKTAEVIAATLTVGEAAAVKSGAGNALNLRQIEAAQTLWDGHNAMNDAREGKWGQAAFGTLVIAINDARVSAMKAAYESAEAAQKFGRDLGAIAGVVEQLENLEPQHDTLRREIFDLTRRLNQCDKLPPPAPLPPKKEPRPQPIPEPIPEPAPPSESPPPEPSPQPTPVPQPEEPPPVIVDPPRPPASGGLCVRRADESAPASELRTLADAALQFHTSAQSAQTALEQHTAMLHDMERANALAGEERVAALRALAPRYDAFMRDYFDLGEITRAQQQRFEPCTAGWAQMVEKIRTRY